MCAPNGANRDLLATRKGVTDMGDNEHIKIDDDLYVNEATVELLRRRIESDVKSDFLRWIGLPIGGAGLAAIALAFFVWIPESVQTFIENDTGIQEELQQTAKGYLSSKDGQVFLRKQVRDTTEEQVNTAVANYLRGAGGEQLTMLVKEELNSPQVTEVITGAINRVLEPFTTDLSERIRDNMVTKVEQVVIQRQTDTEEATDVPEHLAKASVEDLRELINERGDDLKSSGVPVTLDITIRRGRRYTQDAMQAYLRILSTKFGDQFRMVLILDNDQRFLAAVSPELLRTELDNRLMGLLNARSDELSLGDASQALQDRFGSSCSAFVQGDSSVLNAMLSPVWSDPTSLTEDRPVVGQDHIFEGFTTRGQLITGVLEAHS